MKYLIITFFVTTFTFAQVVGTGNNGGPDGKSSDTHEILKKTCMIVIDSTIDFYQVEIKGKNSKKKYTQKDLQKFIQFLELETILKFVEIKTSLTESKLPKCLDEKTNQKLSRYTMIANNLEKLKKYHCLSVDLNIESLSQPGKLEQYIDRLKLLGQLDEN